jgi:hypothetical protein
LYPDIPSINPNGAAESSRDDETETSSLLGNNANITSAATYPVNNFMAAKRIGQQQVQQHAEAMQRQVPKGPVTAGTVTATDGNMDTLIAELVNENWRLEDEVQSLRAALQASPHFPLAYSIRNQLVPFYSNSMELFLVGRNKTYDDNNRL